jgi:hypothetical protein
MVLPLLILNDKESIYKKLSLYFIEFIDMTLQQGN